MTNYFDYIYEPENDSKLLLDTAIKLIEEKHTNICEVGIGSGFVIEGVKKHFNDKKVVKNYFGTDINSYATQYVKSRNSDIEILEGNLLEPINVKQDVILFNTPYLPCEDGESLEDLEIKDRAIYGGKKGYEVIEEFLYQINDKLEDEGFVLMLFSSLSHKKYIEDVLDKNLFEYKLVAERREFFEELYIFKISKSEMLKRINKISDGNLKSVKYFSKGKHSIILEGLVDGGDEVIIKIGDFKDLQIEAIYLKQLQEYGFVPKIYFIDDKNEFIIMEKLVGQTIKEFLDDENDREKIIKVLDKILKVCQKLDELELNKFELTNPYKHIFVDNDLNIKFIDFERTIKSLNPKNTRQILQYFRRNQNLLLSKGIELDSEKVMEIAKRLKEERVEFGIKNLILG